MKNIILPLIAASLLFGSGFEGSTTSAVTLCGGIIKAQHIDNVKKYKRKDCPVCKGAGWYISGDKITKVNCGYCEPETKELPQKTKTDSGVIKSKNIQCGPNGCRVVEQ